MTCLAVFAVAHDIAEPIDVTGGFPDFGMTNDGGIETGNVVAFFHHFVPPESFYGFFECCAIGTVIPESVEAAVNFRALKHKPSAFAERNNFFHQVAFDLNIHLSIPFDYRIVKTLSYPGNIMAFMKYAIYFCKTFAKNAAYAPKSFRNST